MNPLLHATRRHFFQTAGLGVGALALNSLLARDVYGESNNVLADGAKIPAKAKHIIYLHMAGSPSQLELFDYKPELQRLHMQDAPASFLEGKRFAFIKGVPKVLAGQFPFKQRGERAANGSATCCRICRV